MARSDTPRRRAAVATVKLGVASAAVFATAAGWAIFGVSDPQNAAQAQQDPQAQPQAQQSQPGPLAQAPTDGWRERPRRGRRGLDQGQGFPGGDQGFQAPPSDQGDQGSQAAPSDQGSAQQPLFPQARTRTSR